MLEITLDPWIVTENVARLNFRVLDPDRVGIKKIEIAVFKDGFPTVYQTVTGSLLGGQTDISGFTGTVNAVVVVTDGANNAFQAFSEVDVANAALPSPPDFVSYDRVSHRAIRLRWGALAQSPVNQSWRIVDIDNNNVETLLAVVDASTFEQTILIDTEQLHRLVIYGVDGTGNLSGPSPVLSFRQDTGGPVITFGNWQVTQNEAVIEWDITSQGFLTELGYVVTTSGGQTFAGKANTKGKVTVPVALFTGTITVTLTAVDEQARHTVLSSQVSVYNQTVPPPTISIEEIGQTYLRLRVTPPVGDLLTTRVRVFGLSPQPYVLDDDPYVLTVGSLVHNTDYTITARAYDAADNPSVNSVPYQVRTLRNPFEVPPAGQPGARTPIIPTLVRILLEDTPLRLYVLSLTTDGRVRAPRGKQTLKQPAGFNALWDLFLPVAPRFGDILRQETRDQATYTVSVAIDKRKDPLEKLALLAERIEYGYVWNIG